MISTAIFKLSSSNIKDTLSCAFRYKMYKAKKILTGISKAHTSSCTGFVVGSRAGKVESYHTLVLVPDICHTVYMGILAVYNKSGRADPPSNGSDPANAFFTCAEVWYFSCMARAVVLRITFGASHFSSRGFSQYPRRNITVLSLPLGQVQDQSGDWRWDTIHWQQNQYIFPALRRRGRSFPRRTTQEIHLCWCQSRQLGVFTEKKL